MLEIRIHGRGGQGAVTSGQILAVAAFYDGKEVQTFPMFGVERAGAPVQAFVRISDEKINLRSQVYNPDIVIVLEPSLLEVVDVTNGLKPNGIIIVNSNKMPKDLKIKGKFEVHTVDATSIAYEIFKKPIVNTPILGAFSAITKVVTLQSLKKAVHDKFAKEKGETLAELNKQALEKVFKNTH
jgi:pyruvate ferredoxin oxidoreductase gamma subunit